MLHDVTIIDAIASATDRESLPVFEQAGASVLRVTHDALEPVLVAAHRQGPVLVLAQSARAATTALEVGADEVLLPSQCSEQQISAALQRAGWRHQARCGQAWGLDTFALDLLGQSLALGLREPLQATLQNCQALESLLRDMVSSDLHNLASDAAAQVGRLMQQVDCVIALGGAASGRDASLREVVREVVAIARPALESVASVVLNLADEPCIVPATRAELVQVLATLLRLARERCSRLGGQRFIELRLETEASLITLDVADDGEPVKSMVPATWLPGFAVASMRDSSAASLALAAARVRRAGGRLVLYSHDGEGNTVRVTLPHLVEQRANESCDPRPQR